MYTIVHCSERLSKTVIKLQRCKLIEDVNEEREHKGSYVVMRFYCRRPCGEHCMLKMYG